MYAELWEEKLKWIAVLMMLMAFIYGCHSLNMRVTADKVDGKIAHIVIDPGHGGSDPGKVGVNGIVEKDINLKIAMKIKERLEEQKVLVTMTREKDEGVTGKPSAGGKMKDMRKRVEKINKASPDLAVSIHQNSYSDPAVKGAQVFYYTGSEEAKRMAAIVQEELWSLDPESRRKEAANDDYYLFRHTNVPMIIVECGFLSNPREAEKLAEDEYQNIVADTVTKGIMACFKSQN